jgi:glycosyltransferase involved in cell wall biosynthesis
MASKNQSLTIIIPARNEESTIIKTLDNLIKKVRVPCSYIVINDRSTDLTGSKVKKYSRKYKQVLLIETSINKNGFSNALKKGFTIAKSEFVLPVMADNCDDPRTINKMYKKILRGYDVVAGSRYVSGGGKKGGPKMQGFLSKIVCLSLQRITAIPIHDISNSFKIYRKDCFKNLKIPESYGVEVSMYLTLQAYFKGARVTEVPTYWYGRVKGKSKFNPLKRFPRYLSIYLWALKERVLQIIKLKVNSKSILSISKI